MTNEVKKVPELRFPEFDGVWENSKLGTVANVYDGTHQTPKYTIEGIKFLSVENIKTLNSNKFISKEAFEKEFKIRPEFGDVLMTRIGDVGTPNVIETNEDLAYYVSLALLKPKKLNSYFLESLIRSQTVQNELWRKTLHIAFPKKINKNEIAKVEINYPEQMEQQKIGEFFNKLDRQIELEEQKLEKLKEQKKGYMQKIFSQELRFKDDSQNDYPEWKERKFSELLSYSSNGVDKKINKNHDIAYMVNYMDVFKKTKLNTKNRDLLMEITATKIQKEKNNLIRGDILFTPSSETREDIAKSTVVFEDLDNTVYSYHLIRLRPLDSNIFSLKYSNYLSEQNFISKQFRRLAQGAQRYTLTKEYFENIKLNLPHIKEQEKIGDFFSKLDEVINKQIQKIDELKLRKQGFLQKMFV